jgi:glycine/D-amino acid oxidase-like deaminating enzyme
MGGHGRSVADPTFSQRGQCQSAFNASWYAAGHGFKFAPVIGEILADMLVDEPPTFDKSLFSPDRFVFV